MATTYAVNNPNIAALGFSHEDIYKCWGVLALWAAAAINFRPSLNDPDMSCYQAYRNLPANIQTLRMLPIFSVVLINIPAVRKTSTYVVPGVKNSKSKSALTANPSVPATRIDTNNLKRAVGLYVGPVDECPGSIRVLYKDVNGKVHFAYTNQYTTPTQGHMFNIHQDVHAGLERILNAPYPALEPSPTSHLVEAALTDECLMLDSPLYNSWNAPHSIRCLEHHNIYEDDDWTVTPNNSQSTGPWYQRQALDRVLLDLYHESLPRPARPPDAMAVLLLAPNAKPAAPNPSPITPSAPSQNPNQEIHADLRLSQAALVRHRLIFKRAVNHGKLELKFTPDMGIGLFSTSSFEPGSRVALYTRKHYPLDALPRFSYDNRYAYADSHGFAIATSAEREYAPFINDLLSDELNKVKFVWSPDKCLYAIAQDTISPGEQIGCAYGPDYWCSFLNEYHHTPALRHNVMAYYPSIVFAQAGSPQYSLRDWPAPIDVILDSPVVSTSAPQPVVNKLTTPTITPSNRFISLVDDISDSSGGEDTPYRIRSRSDDEDSDDEADTNDVAEDTGVPTTSPTPQPAPNMVITSIERVEQAKSGYLSKRSAALKINGRRVDRPVWKPTNLTRRVLSSPSRSPPPSSTIAPGSPDPPPTDTDDSESLPPTQTESAYEAAFQQLYDANLCDWQELLNPHAQFYSLAHNCFVVIDEFPAEDFDPSLYTGTSDPSPDGTKSADGPTLYCFVTIKDGVPKSFTAALIDPLWKEPAKKEWNLLRDTKCLVRTPHHLARDDIVNKHAQVLHLIPVYEQKKDELGNTIYKVRLVCNGSKQVASAANTYAATPSREQLLILLHVVASHDWDYWHVDESRAFISSVRQDLDPMYAIVKGDPNYYKILKALYGLKTSPRDYQLKVQSTLTKLGYHKLSFSPCIFVKIPPDHPEDILIVYDYVDDFVFTGSNNDLIYQDILEFRKLCTTTKPIRNAPEILGLHITRRRSKRLVLITMAKSILKLLDLLTKHCGTKPRAKNTPMKASDFLVTEEQFAALPPESQEFISDPKVLHLYMSILGSLNWIAGVRFDILLPLVYLAWNTKAPRRHHFQVAEHCALYLLRTQNLPLVLGGPADDTHIVSYCDASLGSAPNGRSIVGSFTKLSAKAGAVSAFSTATPSTYTSIFEGELEAIHKTTKVVLATRHVLLQFMHLMNASAFQVPTIYADNQAVNEFVKGVGIAKGVRHMQLRLWYVRDQYQNLNINIEDIPGQQNPSDKLTKLPDSISIFPFLQSIMGLALIDAPNHLNEGFYADWLIPDPVPDVDPYPFELLHNNTPQTQDIVSDS